MDYETLSRYVTYDPDSGVLSWVSNLDDPHPKRPPGGACFCTLTSKGYHTGVVKGHRMPAHIAAWLLHHGRYPKNEIDHVNRCRTDNRADNLRDVTHAENMANVDIPPSGERNVRQTGRGWYRVRFKRDNEIYENEFATMTAAVSWRDGHPEF